MNQKRKGEASIILKGVIDRLEGECAVIVLTDQKEQLLWSREALPGGAREGVAVEVVLQLDEEETARRERRLQDLVDELFSAEEGKSSCAS